MATSSARTVAVLGAGAWGTVFAQILADAGNEVRIWARRPELAAQINEGENPATCPGQLCMVLKHPATCNGYVRAPEW